MSMTAQPPYTVTELTGIIKDILEGTLTTVSVEGEISNLRSQSSGHLYFTLKDAGAQISVVLFKWDAVRLGFVPQDGMKIVARGQITVYAPRGNYQLKAVSLRPQGKGNLQEQFEILKRKLSEEGLFSDERKKPLPVFPRKVAIITSPTGAAIRDFCHVLRRRCPHIAIQIFGVKVQGEGAADEIIFALEELNKREEVDLIVLARGGGSIEDLWAFNEEKLVRAIAASSLPTISGVGHEIDFTLCDFVADLRAPTPSAAAEILCRADEEWQEELAGLLAAMKLHASSMLETMQWRVKHLAGHYIFREPRRVVEDYSQRLDLLRQSLNRNMIDLIEAWRNSFDILKQRMGRVSPLVILLMKQQRLQALQTHLRLLSPDSTLARGYAMVLGKDGHVVKSAAEAGKEEKLRLRFHDGEQTVRPENE